MFSRLILFFFLGVFTVPLASAANCKIRYSLNCTKEEIPIPLFSDAAHQGYASASLVVEYDTTLKKEVSSDFAEIKKQIEQYLPQFNLIACFRAFPQVSSLITNNGCDSPDVTKFRDQKIESLKTEAKTLEKSWQSKIPFPVFISDNPVENFRLIKSKLSTCFTGDNLNLDGLCPNRLASAFGKLFYNAQLDYKSCKAVKSFCNHLKDRIGATIVALNAQGLDIFAGSEMLFARQPKTWNERNRWFWHLSRSFKVPADPLAIGESRWVTSNETGLSAQYQLTRHTEHHYQIGLNIGFETKEISDFEKKWKPRIRARMEQCYSEASRDLIGPDGDTITLRLLPETKDHKATVNMFSSVDRMDSRTGELSAKCPVILHETMHLLGLVDSYSEGQLGVSYGKDMALEHVTKDADFTSYNMRTTSSESSVMADQDDAYSRVSSNRNSMPSSLSVCTCDQSNDQDLCIAKLTTWDPENAECPAGSNTIEMKSSDVKGNLVSSRGFLASEKGHWVGRVANFQNSSLLYPAEFNALLYPGDATKNWQYYYCSETAYKTSVEHHGFDRLSPEFRKRICAPGGNAWLFGVSQNMLPFLLSD